MSKSLRRTMLAFSAIFVVFLSTNAAAIKVLTYNICWECMTCNNPMGFPGAATCQLAAQVPFATGGMLGEQCKWIKHGTLNVTKCAVNIANEIDKINTYYASSDSYDLVALQEPNQWENLQKISTSLAKLTPVAYKDGNFDFVSFYNPLKYNLEQAINSSFNPDKAGRPLQILILKNKVLNQPNVIFVNLHAPQPGEFERPLAAVADLPTAKAFSDYIEKKLSEALKKGIASEALKKKISGAARLEELKKYRIIVAGDFNDLKGLLLKAEKGAKPLVPFRGAGIPTPVYLDPTSVNANKVPSNTDADLKSCCSVQVPYNRASPNIGPGDYIFDSVPKSVYSKPGTIFKLKVPTKYNFNVPASDHLPVMYEGIR